MIDRAFDISVATTGESTSASKAISIYISFCSLLKVFYSPLIYCLLQHNTTQQIISLYNSLKLVMCSRIRLRLSYFSLYSAVRVYQIKGLGLGLGFGG